MRHRGLGRGLERKKRQLLDNNCKERTIRPFGRIIVEMDKSENKCRFRGGKPGKPRSN